MKMSTTTIFIEYLLIGLVSIIGLFAAINIVIGPENLSMYYSSLSLANSWIPIESLDVKIIFLILLYPFGIVFDKLSSKFFKSFDKSKIMLDQIYFSYEDSLNGLESSIQRAERNKSDDRMTVFTDKNSILLEQYMRNKHIVLLIRTISMVLIINTIAYCFISMNIVANTMILVLLLMRIIDVSFVEF